jgi:2-succinyl-6-hydroxy-2,4-cyclohexadiene-1-carboxylate synthase
MIEHRIILNNNSIKLILLHGFMGCCDDWNELIIYLKPFYDILIIYIDSSKDFIDYIKQLGNFIQEIKWNLNSYIIGYSMGGRIGLELCDLGYFDFKRLILISTNMGLINNKDDRIKIENNIIERLKKKKPIDFLKYWYSMKLFGNYDLYHQIISTRLKYFNKEKYIHYIRDWSVRNQKNRKDQEIMLYIYGELDTKYSLLTKELNKNISKIEIKGAYHSILTNHSHELFKIIRGAVRLN